MQYVNKTTGAVISEEAYRELSYSAQANFVQDSSRRGSSGDFLTSAVVGGVTDSALLGGLLGGNILGGIAGDLFDGDLMD